MTAAWPGSVNPYVLTSGHSESPETNIAEFQPSPGDPSRRRRVGIPTDIISMTVRMTTSQYADFKTFYDTTLLNGSLPFTRLRPRTGLTGTFKFTGAPPTAKDAGYQLWDVSMTVRSLP